MKENLVNVWQGWQCPICKRVYSPYTSMCLYCGGNQQTQPTTPSNLGGFVEEQSSDYRKKTTI